MDLTLGQLVHVGWQVALGVAVGLLVRLVYSALRTPAQRGIAGAWLTRWFRPRLALAKYRAGALEGMKLGRIIEERRHYDTNGCGDRGPVRDWIPEGWERDPLYWIAFERALKVRVRRAFRSSVKRAFVEELEATRSLARAFHSVDRLTRWNL